MKKTKKATRQTTTKAPAAQRDRKEDKKVITLRDVELKHVTGGFCVTPWS